MTVTMDAQKAYTLLGLAFNDPLEKIKKKCRKLALIKHPDKNKTDPNASETFMELQTAYDHLVSLKKVSLQKSKSDSNNNTENNQILEQPLPNEFELKLTLDEIFRGCVKRAKITRKIINKTTGKVQDEEKVLQVPINPGVVTGHRITKEREGDSHVGRIPANVVFIVKEHPHSHFKRSRFHLEYTAMLTIEEVLCGEVLIPTLENVNVPLKIDEIIAERTVKRIPGRGLPIPNGNGKRGDIIVHFKIVLERDRPQDPPVEYSLQLTLEQILHGCTKKILITRFITDANGNETAEDKIVMVHVKPGTEEGFRFAPFKQRGNKRPETIPADIVFIAKGKPHAMFKRIGTDLEYVAKLKLSTLSNTNKCMIPTLDGDELPLLLGTTRPSTVNKRFAGRGLPYLTNADKRGDLIVRIENMDDTKNRFANLVDHLKNTKITRHDCEINVTVTEPVREKTLPFKKASVTKNRYQSAYEKICNQPPENFSKPNHMTQKTPYASLDYNVWATLENILNGDTKQVQIDLLRITNGQIQTERKTAKVDIKPGTVEGTKLQLNAESRNEIPANIGFILMDKPHNTFERNGVDIECRMKISKNDWLNGIDLDIPTLEQETVKLTVRGVFNRQTFRRIQGRGLSHFGNPHMRGDLLVHFDIF